MLLLLIAGLLAAGEPEAVTIVDSGSTNLPGFRIVVAPSGSAEMISGPRRNGAPQEETKPIRRIVPAATVKRLHADIEDASPLDSLPKVHCAKSASFGSTLRVASGKEETPDLSCGDGGSAAMGRLIRDANEIVTLFHDK
jgi:hypothetical protein